MSNLERDPAEVTAAADPAEVTAAADPAEVTLAPENGGGIELLAPREVPLGGPRARPVRRTLPQRQRSLIGAWCFVDHYGPDPVEGRGMDVPPHPHTGLQTVSWLFAGEIEHRDSVGSHAPVRPGELNLMTAGRGIQHSEVSMPGVTTLHGVQLWLALPEAHRHHEPFFEATVAQVVTLENATVRVFMGTLAGVTAETRVFSPLVAAQLDLAPGASLTVSVEPTFEHGLLLDIGDAALDDTAIPLHHLAYAAPGRRELTLTAGPDGARLLLIGGEPLGERIVMWWNFIGRSHDEIVAFRDQWQREVIGGESVSGRFGVVDGYDGRALPAPELPNVRLTSRG